MHFHKRLNLIGVLNSNSESRKYSIESLDLAFNNLRDSVINNDMKAHKNMVISSHLAGKTT